MDELTPEDAVHVAIDDLLTVVAKAGGGLVTTNGYSCDELKALINEMQAIVEAQQKARLVNLVTILTKIRDSQCVWPDIDTRCPLRCAARRR